MDTHTLCLGSFVNKRDAHLIAPFKIAEVKESKQKYDKTKRNQRLVPRCAATVCSMLNQ